jgi:hypothetical protein
VSIVTSRALYSTAICYARGVSLAKRAVAGLLCLCALAAMKGCFERGGSACGEVLTVKDLQALQGGSWERSSLFDTQAFCSATFSAPGKLTNGVFLDLNRDAEAPAAERFLKGMTLVEKLPGADEAYFGVAERGLSTLVLKRPKGALRVQFDAAFTPDQVRQVPALLAPRLPTIDAFLSR